MRNSKGQFVKGFTTETRPKTSVETKCLFCKKSFMVQPHRFLNNRGKFCSMTCRGRGITEDTRKKMSSKRKGKPTGRTGSKCHFWKGGVTPVNKKIRMSLETRIWREAVFERDNWTCVICKIRGGKLNADHIKPFALFPELRFAINNGRTLCVTCHRRTDTYGRKSA